VHQAVARGIRRVDDGVEDGGAVELSRVMTVREVAALLVVPVSTVHHWVARRQGPPSFKVGKHRRFFEDEVVAWIREQRRVAS
jgi:excisionase family DNA binding protein